MGNPTSHEGEVIFWIAKAREVAEEVVGEVVWIFVLVEMVVEDGVGEAVARGK